VVERPAQADDRPGHRPVSGAPPRAPRRDRHRLRRGPPEPGPRHPRRRRRGLRAGGVPCARPPRRSLRWRPT